MALIVCFTGCNKARLADAVYDAAVQGGTAAVYRKER